MAQAIEAILFSGRLFMGRAATRVERGHHRFRTLIGKAQPAGGKMEKVVPTPLQEFGDIDIYVFDQLLRGRIVPGMRVFDAGCGGGRNLVYLLRQGHEVCGNDANASAIAQVRALAAALSGREHDFRVEAIERTSFPDCHAEVVMASAVLHFAREASHFEAMLRQMWRVLRPGGLFFARLASNIGIADAVTPLGGGRFRLPDGSDRFLVDAAAIEEWTARLGGELIDPIKTTVVQGQRSMTTWVARLTDRPPTSRTNS
jgi:tellurite methyltransferase